MNSKFRIFCDEPSQQPLAGGVGLEKDKLSRREPLALRQHFQQERPPSSPSPPISQQHNHQLHQHQLQLQQSQQLHLEQEPDQENDISIASLGSDFVPSIINEEFDSFECDEESGNITEIKTESDGPNNDHDFDRYMIDDELDVSEGDMLDDDVDLDEDTRNELNAALKKHDDFVLLNSAVFIDDIVDYLHQLEADTDLRPIPNYMLFHHDVDSNKRAILINWLVEVTDEYELQTETLFICISIIDRFLSKMSIATSHFQLLGVAAMFIATKYEEIYPPYLHQFVEVTDETFSGKQIIQMEQEILRTLDFRISTPTMTYFLRQIFAFNRFTRKVFHLAEYFCHLSLLADRPFLEYLPSEIALAAVILAAHQLDAAGNISTELRSAYDKSNQAQLKRRDASNSSNGEMSARDNQQYAVSKDSPFCIESLRAMQERVPRDSAIYIKYSSDAHDCVACLPAPSIEDIRQLA